MMRRPPHGQLVADLDRPARFGVHSDDQRPSSTHSCGVQVRRHLDHASVEHCLPAPGDRALGGVKAAGYRSPRGTPVDLKGDGDLPVSGSRVWSRCWARRRTVATSEGY